MHPSEKARAATGTWCASSVAHVAPVFTSRSEIAPDASPAAMYGPGVLAASARTTPTFTHHNSLPVEADRAVTSSERVAAQIVSTSGANTIGGGNASSRA